MKKDLECILDSIFELGSSYEERLRLIHTKSSPDDEKSREDQKLYNDVSLEFARLKNLVRGVQIP